MTKYYLQRLFWNIQLPNDNNGYCAVFADLTIQSIHRALLIFSLAIIKDTGRFHFCIRRQCCYSGLLKHIPWWLETVSRDILFAKIAKPKTTMAYCLGKPFSRNTGIKLFCADVSANVNVYVLLLKCVHATIMVIGIRNSIMVIIVYRCPLNITLSVHLQ